MIRARAIGDSVFLDHDGTLTLFWHCPNPVLAPALCHQVNDLIDVVSRDIPIPPCTAAHAAVAPDDYDPGEWLDPECDE